MATAMALGVAMQLVGVPPIRALFAASIVNGLVAPVVLVVVLVLAGSQAVLGKRIEARWVLLALCVGGASTVALPVAWLLSSLR